VAPAGRPNRLWCGVGQAITVPTLTEPEDERRRRELEQAALAARGPGAEGGVAHRHPAEG
jgi:hypothetical protein